MAWEHRRLGGPGEMNSWWIQHADPQLDRIFDPEGPFKYCSVADGHRAKLVPLPTVTAPRGLFPAERDTSAGSCPSGQHAPGPPTGPAPAGGDDGVVLEFP
jgi:hypothetical protein